MHNYYSTISSEFLGSLPTFGYFFNDKYKLKEKQTVQHRFQISDREHWYLNIIHKPMYTIKKPQ